MDNTSAFQAHFEIHLKFSCIMKHLRPGVTIFDLPLSPLRNTVPPFSQIYSYPYARVSLTGNEARVQFISSWRSQYLGGKRTWVCLMEYRTLWMDTRSLQVYSSNWDRRSFKSSLSVQISQVQQEKIDSTGCRKPSYVWPYLISTEYVKWSTISALLPDVCTEHHQPNKTPHLFRISSINPAA